MKKKLLPFALTLIVLVCLLTTAAFADGATAAVDESGIMTISGTGELAKNALDGIDNLGDVVEIQIGAGITSLPNGIFKECDHLTSISVDSENTVYKSVDGVLFTADGKALICYPAKSAETSYTVPDGTTAVLAYAFYECNTLTEVTLPSSLTTIGAEAFRNCSYLTSLTVPSSVTYIGRDAFVGCNGLEWAKNCDHSKTNVRNAKDATCTEKGYTGDTYCSACGALVKNGTDVDMVAHTYGEWKTKTAATCTAEGVSERICSVCGKADTKAIAKLSHSYTEKVVPPTCTDKGYTLHTCKTCNESYKDTWTDALGHKYGSWTVKKAATCEASGTSERVCSVCKHVDTRTDAKLGHNYTNKVVAPTCTENGYTLHTCKNCNNSYKDTETKALGHDYTSNVVKPTCTEKGYTLHTCKNCNDSYKDTETKALGHKWDEGKVTTEPAIGKDGVLTKTCTVCKATTTEPMPALESPFTDVPSDSWYVESVTWAVDKGITTGTSETTFNPNGICTRAQIVTFLWRANGFPEPKSAKSPFVDVTNSSAYYYKAVLWAAENNITNGVDDTHFAPMSSCTRSQIVTFLWRANNKPNVTAKNPFTDVPGDIWYTSSVLWAVDKKITNGMTATEFEPDSPCTRAQAVTFIFRNYK